MIQLNTKELINALKLLKPLAKAHKNGDDIWGCIQIFFCCDSGGRVDLIGYDGDKRLRLALHGQAALGATFWIATVPLKALEQAVPLFKKDEKIVLDRNLVDLIINDKIRIPLKENRGFPKNTFEENSYKNYEFVHLSIDVWQEAINLTKWTICTDIGRFYLHGINLKIYNCEKTNTAYLAAAATNGQTLVKTIIEKNVKTTPFLEKGIIIPTETIKLLSAVLKAAKPGTEVRAAFKENKMFFNIGCHTLCSKAVDGNFPDIIRVIPAKTKEDIIIGLEKQELINNISFALNGDLKSNSGIELDFDTGMCEAKDRKTYKELEQGHKKIGFLPVNILGVLNNFKEDTLFFRLNANKFGKYGYSDAVPIEDISGNTVFVIMPCQL